VVDATWLEVDVGLEVEGALLEEVGTVTVCECDVLWTEMANVVR